MNSQIIGLQGEKVAAEYLSDHGYRILARNYKCRFGEIDIVALQEGYLVFVEVKLRKTDRYGAPREYVTYAKQKKIKTAASFFLASHPEYQLIRFDVIEILTPNGTNQDFTITHLENAFQ